MRMFGRHDFSFGWSLFEGPSFTVKKGAKDDFAARAKQVRDWLRVDENAHKAVNLGMHQEIQFIVSPFQQNIRVIYYDWAEFECEHFAALQADLVFQQEALMQDPADGDHVAASCQLDAALHGTFVAFDQRIRELVSSQLDAEDNLRDFEQENDAENRPTPKPLLSVIGITVPASVAEATVSVIAFQSELGSYSSFVFGLMTSLLLLVPAAVGGIGYYLAGKAPKTMRKPVRGWILMIGAAVAFAGLGFLSTHWRMALLGEKDNPAKAAAESIAATPWEFTTDLPIIAFLVFSLVVGTLVAAKFGQVIVWKQLTRLRKAKAKASDEVVDWRDDAIAETHDARDQASVQRNDLHDRAGAATEAVAALRKAGHKAATALNRVLGRIAAEYWSAESDYRARVIADLRALMEKVGPFTIAIEPMRALGVTKVEPDAQLRANESAMVERNKRWKTERADWDRRDAEAAMSMAKQIGERHGAVDKQERLSRYAPLRVVHG